MNEPDLRVRIRELVKSGLLPRTLPPVGARIEIEYVSGETCIACIEEDPFVTYFYPGDLPVRLHGTCENIWKQEVGLLADLSSRTPAAPTAADPRPRPRPSPSAGTLPRRRT